MACGSVDYIRWLLAPELAQNGFPLAFMEQTGEILRIKRVATYKGLTFTLIPSGESGYRLEISGSLHRYHNGGTDNSSRFGVADIQAVIMDLVERFGIVPDKTPLENLEIGVNIGLPFSPLRVINAAVVCHNKGFAPINAGRLYLGKRCVLSEYEVKIYDKGKQIGNPGLNLLRVEVKVRKMRQLRDYGIKTLADLSDPAKLRPLVELLLSALANTVFIDPCANLDPLTESERTTFYKLRDPLTWSRKNPIMNYWKRQDYQQRLSLILEKCNVFDYQTDLYKRVTDEWQTLSCEAETAPAICGQTDTGEAVEKAMISPLECVGEIIATPLQIATQKDGGCLLPDVPQNRVCLSCEKPLTGQRVGSLFCSEKYNGAKAARHCRNRDSNQRRTKRNQIMRAKERNQFLRITYTVGGQSYSEILHSSEVAVSRHYLNTVLSVEILAGCPGVDLFGAKCSGSCDNCQSRHIPGSAARALLAELTNENGPGSPGPKMPGVDLPSVDLPGVDSLGVDSPGVPLDHAAPGSLLAEVAGLVSG